MTDSAEPIPAQDAAALCTGCGLCCAGLFAKVRLVPADLALASRVGEPSLRAAERVFARLPCAFLTDTRCSVYAERYTACRTFECKLLRRFKRGELPLAAARHRIAEMRRLMDAARRSPPREQPEADPRRQRAQALLLQASFTLYANTHFRPGPAPKGLS